MEQNAKASVREKLGELTDPEVAAALGIEVPTLKNRRSKGDAPESAKVGRDHLTNIADLKRYIARRRAKAGARKAA